MVQSCGYEDSITITIYTFLLVMRIVEMKQTPSDIWGQMVKIAKYCPITLVKASGIWEYLIYSIQNIKENWKCIK